MTFETANENQVFSCRANSDCYVLSLQISIGSWQLEKKLLALLIQKFESLSQCLDEVSNSHVQATKNN